MPSPLALDQHLHLPVPVACVRTPPPEYQEPPISLRPLYHADNSSKVSVLAYKPYPFQNAETKDDLPECRLKLPFWRTKKGIALIVLLSNVVILGIVLGIVFGSRHDRHRRSSFTHGGNNSLGQNTEGPPSSVNQSNSLPLSDSSLATTSSSLTSSTSPTSSTTFTGLPLFTPVISSSGRASQVEPDETKQGSGTTETGVLLDASPTSSVNWSTA